MLDSSLHSLTRIVGELLSHVNFVRRFRFSSQFDILGKKPKPPELCTQWRFFFYPEFQFWSVTHKKMPRPSNKVLQWYRPILSKLFLNHFHKWVHSTWYRNHNSFWFCYKKLIQKTTLCSSMKFSLLMRIHAQFGVDVYV